MASRIRSLGGWSLALAASALLNICLFALMPGLIQGVPDLNKSLEDYKQIQVIRVKREDPPPVKKKTPPKNEAVRPRTAARSKTPPPKQRPMNLKPRLAFKINTRLPATPMDLNLPAIENFSMGGPVLKDLYDINELDSPLTPLVKIPPLYPMRAKRRMIEGFVTIEFRVTKSGRVEQVKILKSEPKGMFEKSVMDCVSRWKFKPGTVEGIPVAARAHTTIRFELEE
ncbi:energy transducer TonB [Desulfospira joergensenii]|uniref:energy transducer TonB n=1 Tax=Desulfospira joergensenii TaxID=53329 RepID=UPI0003B6E5DB|nr:energy transducer TonB [Desulfospira joergensenii]